MSIQFESAGAAIRRTTGTFLSGASDFTVAFWAQYWVTPAVGHRVLFWQLATASLSGGPNVQISGGNGATTVNLAVTDTALVPHDVTGLSAVPVTWYHVAVVYVAATKTVTLYVNTVSQGSVTADLTTAVFTREDMGDDTSGYSGGIQVAYVREWQAALSGSAIATEMASPTPVQTANLFTDTPLPMRSIYTDLTGNGHTWVEAGTTPTTPNVNFAVFPTPTTGVTVIPSITYTDPVDLSGATHHPAVPSCRHESGTYYDYVTNAAFWKYTPPAGTTFLFLAAGATTGADPNYNPNVSVWVEGFPGVLINYVVTSVEPGFPDSNEFCGSEWGAVGGVNAGGWFRVVVTPGTTYWFEVFSSPASSFAPFLTGALVTLQVEAAPTTTIPGGAIVVPDDTDPFPAAVFNGQTGEFYAYPPFPAGETADTQPDGHICTQDGNLDVGVAFFDASFTRIATWAGTGTGEFIYGIKSDRNGRFYVVTRSGSVPPYADSVWIFDAVGHFISSHYLGGSPFVLGRTFAVSRDGTTWFQGDSYASVIHVFDLVTDTALPDLTISTPGANMGSGGIGDGYVALDGTLVFAKNNRIERYNPTTGALIQAYTPTTITTINHFAFADDVPGSFVIWGYNTVTDPNSSNAIFERFLLDGTHSWTSPSIPVGGNIQNAGGTSTGSISSSCPLFIIPTPTGPPPPTPGSITVSKTVTPTAFLSFPFTAGGGLTPTSFTLTNGGTQTFTSVPVGSGYSITETPPAGYTVTYAVSNSSPNTNISVAAGESVTVAVTNTSGSAAVSGGSMDCSTDILTITGSGFRVGATITVHDPSGANVGFTLLSFSSTVITVELDYTGPGTYAVSVVNPA